MIRAQIRWISLGAAIGLGALACACEQGPAERAGEEMDSAYERATQGDPDLTDGPLERAGEEIDEAGEAARRTADDIGDRAREEMDKSTDAEEPVKTPSRP
jgi:hypothetical protein